MVLQWSILPHFDPSPGSQAYEWRFSLFIGRKRPTSIVDPKESAETFSFRVDKAWRQRCSQRFRNILDMIAKKAPQWWQLTNKNPTKVTTPQCFMKGWYCIDTLQILPPKVLASKIVGCCYRMLQGKATFWRVQTEGLGLGRWNMWISQRPPLCVLIRFMAVPIFRVPIFGSISSCHICQMVAGIHVQYHHGFFRSLIMGWWPFGLMWFVNRLLSVDVTRFFWKA